MRPCDHAQQGRPAPGCRVCELYFADPAYRALWDGEAKAGRSLPCLRLGDVLDKGGCNCPGKWVRACELYGTCTLERCKACPDYATGL